MNHGGEPGRDDYGLPRVEIQIPDDARELDREVQAYHRELRALRRQERSRRWRAPLRRSGLILPVIAGLLVLAMLTGMVLTMFSADPSFSRGTGSQGGRPRATQHRPGTSAGSNAASRPAMAAPTGAAPTSAAPTSAAPSSAAPSGAASRFPPLPAKTIVLSTGKRVWLPGLKATALAIIPANCRCGAVIRQLLAQAMSAGIRVYLVGASGSRIAALDNLTPASSKNTAVLAIDEGNALKNAYRPHGLEILLVDSRGVVQVESGLRPGFRIERTLRQLKPSR